MKLLWSEGKKSVVLLAETPYEVAFGEIFLEGMNYHRYATTKKGGRIFKAKFTVIPELEENKA